MTFLGHVKAQISIPLSYNSHSGNQSFIGMTSEEQRYLGLYCLVPVRCPWQPSETGDH